MSTPLRLPEDARPRLRRDWGLGLRSAAAWCRNPLDGIDKAFEFIFALAGPLVQREFDDFSSHPTGKRLLHERPDLLEHLSDREALARMPEGSFGRAYLDFVSQQNMEDARSFSELAKLDTMAARLGWSDDIRWFVGRMLPSHDVFHVLTGYGRETSSEGAVIVFTFGQWPIRALWVMVLFLALLRPRAGWRRWHEFLREAHRRGQDARPLSCADYERLLPLPLEAVRRELRVASLEEAHPDGVIRDWMGLKPDAKAMTGEAVPMRIALWPRRRAG